MKKKNIALNSAWRAFDYFLLGGVVLLLVVGYARMITKHAPQPSASDTKVAPVSNEPRAHTPIHGAMRVSAPARRVSAIARSLIAADWDNLPTRPALETRETDGFYEVLCTLSPEIDSQKIQLTAQGHTLQIALHGTDGHQVMIRRFRLPYPVEHEHQMTSAISNRLLRIKVAPNTP